jgi:transcription elongation factor Elf1
MEDAPPLVVYFGCPHCPAVYRAIQHASGASEIGSFVCRNCGIIVYSWRGQHSYTDWRLFNPKAGRVVERLQDQENDSTIPTTNEKRTA